MAEKKSGPLSVKNMTDEEEKVLAESEQEAPKEALEAEAPIEDGTLLTYIGKNPSYTIGRVRFERGQTRAVEPENVDAALATGAFQQVRKG